MIDTTQRDYLVKRINEEYNAVKSALPSTKNRPKQPETVFYTLDQWREIIKEGDFRFNVNSMNYNTPFNQTEAVYSTVWLLPLVSTKVDNTPVIDAQKLHKDLLDEKNKVLDQLMLGTSETEFVSLLTSFKTFANNLLETVKNGK